MHISFAGKKVRLLALAVTIFMIIFVSANWRLYLDPDLNLQGGPFCLFCRFLPVRLLDF